MFKWAGENQCRVRQAIGDRQDAAHRAGKYVDQSCAEIKSAQKDAHLRPWQDYTITGATRMTGFVRPGCATCLGGRRQRRAGISANPLDHRAEPVGALRRQMLLEAEPLEQLDG